MRGEFGFSRELEGVSRTLGETRQQLIQKRTQNKKVPTNFFLRQSITNSTYTPPPQPPLELPIQGTLNTPNLTQLITDKSPTALYY